MAGAAQKSCWFKSLALSSLGVVLSEGDLVDTGIQTVILKMIQANQDYCLAYSPGEEEDSAWQAERQGWSIFISSNLRILNLELSEFGIVRVF